MLAAVWFFLNRTRAGVGGASGRGRTTILPTLWAIP